MTASATGLTGSPLTFTATGVAGVPTQIGIRTQPSGAVSGVVLTTQPVVQIHDANNNLVTTATNSVTTAISSGGALTGAMLVSAVNGVATFSDLRVTGTGATRLSFSATGLTSATSNSFTVTTGDLDPCLTVPTIALGDTRTGSLVTSDCQYTDGSYVDRYQLTLSGSTAVQIDLTSTAFDTYLIVTNATGTVVAYDDDGGGGLNSLISATLAAGVYTIAATSYSAGETGAYTLSITRPVEDPCSSATTITAGQSQAGSLATSDCRLTDGRYADRWQFTVTAATTVRLALSASFDTYLYVTNTGGTTVGEDDDSGPGTDSQLELTLTAGTYIAWATSFSSRVTGAYSLTFTQSPPACSSANTITLGQTVSGVLSTSDCQLGNGSYADRWEFTMASAAAATVSMTSTAFDAFLILSNSAGNVIASNDDGGGGTNSRIVQALAAGTYTVWANSYTAGATGSYQLSVTTASSGCLTSAPISLGQTVNGGLETTDCRLADGSYADRWQLTLAATTALNISLTSTAFDAYLFLVDANGATVAADDDGGVGTNARIQGTFPAGAYIIYANSFSAAETGVYQLAVTSASSGAVNLRIDRIYLMQSTQTSTGSVPLIRDRDALLRVFVRADQANSATPSVRVRFYSGTTLLDTRAIVAPGGATPTALNEGTLSSTWNLVVPASLIQPNVAVLVDVDPTNAIAESNDNDNAYPASGSPLVLDVRTMPTFNLTLIPVTQSANNRTGSVTSATQNSFLSMTRAIWPLGAVSTTVRAAYTTTLPALLSGDENGSWGALLSEIAALRTLEAPSRYYYGVVNVSYNSGIAGVGYIGSPTAIGWDYLPSRNEVTAHEIGHNVGRRHAPCGNPGGPDANYPYPNGAIGVYGYDLAAATLKPPTIPDIMSYCSDPWISDYSFRGALDYLKNNPLSAAGGATESVLLWGRIDGDVLTLEPALEFVARPTAKPVSGPYRLEGFDAAGQLMIDFAFTPDEVADSPRPSKHFAFVVPKSDFLGLQLETLRFTGPAGARASIQGPSAAARLAIGTVQLPTASRRSASVVDVRWDASRYPVAVIRSTSTGQIVSFARGGLASIAMSDTEVELVLSDGVQSTRLTLIVSR